MIKSRRLRWYNQSCSMTKCTVVFFKIFLNFVCMNILLPCCSMEGRRFWIPWNLIVDGCELAYGCWDLRLGLLHG